jgi:hypothetical protein
MDTIDMRRVHKKRKFNEGTIELVCEDGTSLSTEIDIHLMKHSVVLREMLDDLEGIGGRDDNVPCPRCKIQCDTKSSLELLMRLMAAETSVDVDMTRMQMAAMLRLMHFLNIPWELYMHLRCRCSSSSGWDAPSMQAWVELVSMDWRAAQFTTYKSGSDLMYVDGIKVRPQDSVEAASRWVCHAAEIGRAEGTFEALAVEMLAAVAANTDTAKVVDYAGVAWVNTGIVLKALALGAVREGARGHSTSLPRVAKAASTLLCERYCDYRWEEAFDDDVVKAIDLWDGKVGSDSDYNAFLCIKPFEGLLCLASRHCHTLHDAAHKWLAIVHRSRPSSTSTSSI